MIPKLTMKYIYLCIGVFMLYTVVTINIISRVGNQYRLPLRPDSVQGPIRNMADTSDTLSLDSPYVILGDYDGETANLTEIEEQTRLMFENSIKRKRKILAQIMQDYDKSKQSMGKESRSKFIFIGNISLFSAFYDDRENLDLDSPLIRIMGIAPRDSTESLVCRYTNNGADAWILAQKHEMCENHDKVYGGFMFSCKSPKDVDLIPKKIYIKSLNDLEETSQPVNSSSACLDILPIRHKKVDKMIYQYDSLFDDDDNFSPHAWEGRLMEDIESNHIARKLLNIHNSTAHTRSRHEDIYKKPPINDNTGKLNLSSTNNIMHQTASYFDVAVCVPPLFGSIQLSSLIQFIEFLKLQKVNKIFVYVMTISREVEIVLDYYRNQGFLNTIQWSLPDHIKSSIWYHGQMITIQDCLYRTMGTFDYVAFLDIDELIIPKTSPDWPTMLKKFEKFYHTEDYSQAGGYNFLSAFFDPNLVDSDPSLDSKYKLSFLKSIYRTNTFSHVRTKLIIQPEYVIEMGIHHISQPLVTFYNITTQEVATETAAIHHYRPCSMQADERMVCSDIVKDKSVLKYAERLKVNYQEAVKQILNIMKSD